MGSTFMLSESRVGGDKTGSTDSFGDKGSGASDAFNVASAEIVSVALGAMIPCKSSVTICLLGFTFVWFVDCEVVSVAATVVLVVGSSTLLGGILDGSGARLSLVVTTRGSKGGKDMTTGSDLGVGSGSSCPFPRFPGCGGLILVVVAVAVTLAPSAASGFELEFAAAAFSLLLAIAVAAKPEGWSEDLEGSGFILDNADRKALKRKGEKKERTRSGARYTSREEVDI